MLKIVALAFFGLSFTAQADLPVDLPIVEKLKKPNNAWVWVSDGTGDFSKSRLFDTTSGKMLGMLSTGYWSGGLVLPSHGRDIYAIQTHFSRSTRGQRTDILAIYDPETLLEKGEIEIPPRRMSALIQKGLSSVTADDNFLMVQNFTPAQSISIIDLKNKRFVAEIESPGCTGVYANSSVTFSAICGDGSLMWVQMDATGNVIDKGFTDPFFDSYEDPVAADGVRVDNQWLYASHNGYVYPVDVSNVVPVAVERWSFLTDQERADGWRFGGFNHIDAHPQSRRLFILMQDGGEDSYEEPGKEVWVFNIDSHERIARFELEHMALGLEVSMEEEPHLYTSAVTFPIPTWAVVMLAVFGHESSLMEIADFGLDIYQADTGKLERTIENATSAPTLLQGW
jgi:methylamine dehydrogenase heavy chain|tara:strand:- start:684 stop:1874 length:1191 start_codon:yes stop_codon:yes gene_type:complete